MITAVDSNVLLDVFTDAPDFGDKSASALRKQLQLGSLVACGVVYAEIATFFKQSDDCLEVLARLGVDFYPDSQASAIAAASAWQGYKKAGGRRQRLIADFLIGAHALVHCDALLTRDRGFYRSYFRGLTVIDPS